MNQEKHDRQLNSAWHEAAHAIVATYLGLHVDYVQVHHVDSLKPSADRSDGLLEGGYCAVLHLSCTVTNREVFNRIVELFAGGLAAQKRSGNESSANNTGDLEKIAYLARVCNFSDELVGFLKQNSELILQMPHVDRAIATLARKLLEVMQSGVGVSGDHVREIYAEHAGEN